MPATVRDDELFAAWTAGFFDGEGSTGAYETSRGIALRVDIGQKFVEPLLEIQSRYGGSLRNCGAHYKLFWSGRSAEQLLRSIAPYLRVKHTQVRLALEFIDTIGGPGSAKTIEVIKRRLEIVQEMKHLKVVGG